MAHRAGSGVRKVPGGKAAGSGSNQRRIQGGGGASGGSARQKDLADPGIKSKGVSLGSRKGR